MVIVNTTFIIHPAIEDEIVPWIAEKYAGSAKKHADRTHEPLLTKVLGIHQADGLSYAMHIYFYDLEQAKAWSDGVGAAMRRIATDRYGDKALTFVTYLEVIEP